jgi:hypothetical protein
MNYDSLQKTIVPLRRKKWSTLGNYNSGLHLIISPDTKTCEISAKEMHEIQSPEIPLVHNKEEESKWHQRISKQGLLKYTEFTDPKISSMIRSKEKS